MKAFGTYYYGKKFYKHLIEFGNSMSKMQR